MQQVMFRASNESARKIADDCAGQNDLHLLAKGGGNALSHLELLLSYVIWTERVVEELTHYGGSIYE